MLKSCYVGTYFLFLSMGHGQKVLQCIMKKVNKEIMGT